MRIILGKIQRQRIFRSFYRFWFSSTFDEIAMYNVLLRIIEDEERSIYIELKRTIEINQ